jgi:hypothetical protein
VASASLIVADGSGEAEGVGWGTSSFCPIYRLLQSAGRLFRVIMELVEILYTAAIMLQLSPDLTEYSMGGSGVKDGIGEGVSLGSGVAVIVGEGEAVGVLVGCVTLPVPLRIE